MIKWFFATILLFLFLFDISSLPNERKYVTASEQKTEDILYFAVDGFEVKDGWNIHFSKFRSKGWKGNETKHTPNRAWIKWLQADDSKPNYERKNLLPPEVYKNPLLKSENTILTVRGNWDKKGSNWLSLTPSTRKVAKENVGRENINDLKYSTDKSAHPNYILLGGITSDLYCYAWGMGYNYKIEAYIKDYVGNSFVLPGGYLNFYGWKTIRFNVPKYVKQTSKLLPRVRPIKLIQLKIVAAVDETNHGFYTYLDYLHARSNIYIKPFFGSQLGTGNELYWNESGNTDSPN